MVAPKSAPAKDYYTYDDYLALDDGNRYEIIEGELVLTPSPSIIHQYIAAKIETAIRNFVEQGNLGMVVGAPFDVVLDKDVVLQPDVLFVSRERYRIITADCLKGEPDLVVEVISPSSGVRDRIKKSRIYRRYGVKEYWLVDPGARTVEVLAEGDRGWFLAGAYDEEEILTSPLLPGLQVKLKEIFALPEGLILE
ncbi:MAG: Uma2 family endonuclease [Firmicutes bacterium]|nr:Uma2 family endonuclease [Bacillota bacterium]